MLIGGADFYEEYTRARTRENAKLSQKFCTCQNHGCANADTAEVLLGTHTTLQKA